MLELQDVSAALAFACGCTPDHRAVVEQLSSFLLEQFSAQVGPGRAKEAEEAPHASVRHGVSRKPSQDGNARPTQDLALCSLAVLQALGKALPPDEAIRTVQPGLTALLAHAASSSREVRYGCVQCMASLVQSFGDSLGAVKQVGTAPAFMHACMHGPL